MVRLEDAVVARFKKGKKVFEVLVDPYGAENVRGRRGKNAESGTEEIGEISEISEILAVEEIFEDASKGERAKEDDLRAVFGTTDVREIALRILKEGEIQLTTEQRRRITEEKRRAVIDRISRICVNPQTNTPHPPTRIEIALKEAKFHIDAMKSIDSLVKDAINALKPILPIKVHTNEIAVKIPAAYTGRIYEIKRNYEIIKEEWQPDGSFIAILRVPAGMKDELFALLNEITRGEVETKILK